MYTADKAYEQIILQQAREAIAGVKHRYASKKRRLQELETIRTMYKGCGDWQAGIDLLEEQMVTWGRVEHPENVALCQRYAEEMQKYGQDATGLHLSLKSEWSDEDRHTFGMSHAYDEARYALRFHSLPDAIAALDKQFQELQASDEACGVYEEQKRRGEADGIAHILSQLRSIKASHHQSFVGNGVL